MPPHKTQAPPALPRCCQAGTIFLQSAQFFLGTNQAIYDLPMKNKETIDQYHCWERLLYTFLAKNIPIYKVLWDSMSNFILYI